MPNPNAIVSNRIRLEKPPERAAAEYVRAEGALSVELDDGRRVQLDPDDRRTPGFAQVLEGLSQLGRPVYLEVDPESSAVTRLLIPHVTRIAALRQIDEGYDVEIEYSHARHKLKRDNPDFAEIEAQLREAIESKAPVILTEDDDHDIIDFRFFRPGPESGPLIPAEVEPADRPVGLRGLMLRIWYWPIWPWWWWWRGCISMPRAQQVFDAMSATSCNPLTVPPPCIPFLYPDDGCWGRAHEMCRLMIAMGLSPKKVWIQGWLHTPTRNNPNCFVNWGWHVAPTLCVRQGCLFWFWTAQMVIDPSLFTTPVTQATWKSVQGDSNATLTPSAASIFYLWGNVTDPAYVQTNQVLAIYRLQLQNRSNSAAGPPPYAHCP